MSSGPGRCQVCTARPAAMAGAGYCFDCWPGGPVTPPPCRRCGARTDYYTGGLCAGCHPQAPQAVGSCRDCLAWGATRTNKWWCKTCASHWRERYRPAVCASCQRIVPLHPQGGCRLCRRQRSMALKTQWDATLESANRHGQQLFFVDMFGAARSASPRPRQRSPIAAGPVTITPVSYRQLVIFDWPRELAAGARNGFLRPPDPHLAAALEQVVADRGRRYGWQQSIAERVRRGLRILLGMQDTPGAPFRASEVVMLARLQIPVSHVLEVLSDAGLLEEDRTPASVRWFAGQIADLPDGIRHELTVWFDVMRNGSTVPPRRRPRSDRTAASQLRWALPAIRRWAAHHESLREISRDHVLAALPAGGSPRLCMLQGLRSIFRVLKGRQLVFVNPTARISIPGDNRTQAPPAVNLGALRAALDSDDVTAAALAALLAFHAVRIRQLTSLMLTDVRDGRLHIDDQVIPLAAAVRGRLSAYLRYRSEQFPATVNPHLFVHHRNVQGIRPVTPWWIRRRLGMSGQAIRQDRILDEAHASHGDVRLVCDLFGLSVAGAYRYTTAVGRLDTAGVPS